MADEMAGGGAQGGANEPEPEPAAKAAKKAGRPPSEVHERRKASIDNWRGSPSNAAGFACIVLERLEEYHDDGHLHCKCGKSIFVDCKWTRWTVQGTRPSSSSLSRGLRSANLWPRAPRRVRQPLHSWRQTSSPAKQTRAVPCASCSMRSLLRSALRRTP